MYICKVGRGYRAALKVSKRLFRNKFTFLNDYRPVKDIMDVLQHIRDRKEVKTPRGLFDG
jgi:hypothetical protein